MAGHRGIHQRWGLGGCREVIPGTEQSTLPLTRRFPWRVAKSHLRKDDIRTVNLTDARESQEQVMLATHLLRIVDARRPSGLKKIKTELFPSIRSLIVGY